MPIRTVPEGAPLWDAPPDGAEEAERRCEVLRARFPGAVIRRYGALAPTVAEGVMVAEGAVLIGDVTLGVDASVWFQAVLRADLAPIRIGARSNVQDGAVIHVGDLDPTEVGDDVVVGHRAVLHGCRVGSRTLIGIGSVVLDGADIGEGSIVGAGAVVGAASVVPPASLVLGVPARVVKTLPPGAGDFHAALAAKYVRLQTNHRRG